MIKPLIVSKTAVLHVGTVHVYFQFFDYILFTQTETQSTSNAVVVLLHSNSARQQLK